MWKHIQIEANCIERYSEKAVLIKMPRKSRYRGFSFWHPAKLVRHLPNGWLIQISFTDDFEFKLRKYGRGKYSWGELLAERELDADEIMEAFGFGSEAQYEDLDDLREDD